MVAYTLLESGLLRYGARMRFNGDWEACVRTAPFSARPGIPWDEQVAEAARRAPYSTGTGGFVLRQVRRTHDGLLGGFVADESCLFQEGTCFVHHPAQVWAGGRVTGNAQVSGEAVIKGTVEDDAVVEGGEIQGRVGGRVRVSTYVPDWQWLRDGPHPWGNATTAAYALFMLEFRRPPSDERLEYWAGRVSTLMEQKGLTADAPGAALEQALTPLTGVMRVTLEDMVDQVCANITPAERERRLGFFREAMAHPVFLEGRRPDESVASWMSSGLSWLHAYLEATPGTYVAELSTALPEAFMELRGRPPTPAEVAAVAVHWRGQSSVPPGLLRAALGAPPPPPEPPPNPDPPPDATGEDMLASLMLNMVGNARERGMLNDARLGKLVKEAQSVIGGGRAMDTLAQGLAAFAREGAPGRRPARPPPSYVQVPPPQSPQELLANLRKLHPR